PYHAVLTHGFTVDGQGKKMSKSLGNVIAPQEIINSNGAEIVRLWVAAEDYRDDVRLSKEIVNRLTEAYRKIRNTGRFLLGNLNDFDQGDYRSDLLEIDRWAMSRLQGLIRRVTAAYERFDFHEVFHAVYGFCVVDMSSFYLDILKDRLYTYRAVSRERRAAQWVLRQVLIDMTRLLAPVLSFTAEEIWGYVQNKTEESIFLAGFPNVKDEFIDEALETRWSKLITIRDEANKALEIKRKDKFIGNALEAKLVFYAADAEFALLENYKGFLPALFIVSVAETRLFTGPIPDAYESTEIKHFYIKVERASGNKCERCWNWSELVGSFEDHPEVCERCYHAIK